MITIALQKATIHEVLLTFRCYLVIAEHLRNVRLTLKLAQVNINTRERQIAAPRNPARRDKCAGT